MMLSTLIKHTGRIPVRSPQGMISCILHHIIIVDTLHYAMSIPAPSKECRVAEISGWLIKINLPYINNVHSNELLSQF